MKKLLYRVFRRMAMLNILNLIPDIVFIKIIWWLRMDYHLDLKNPETFNEKLQWLKLYYRNTLYETLVDKYAVRNYVSEKIGNQYLIPLLGVYQDVSEIKWDTLPEKFVLKCTHDSGSSIICKDKSQLNKNLAYKKLSKRLKNNITYNNLREWPYKNVKRRIICEKYMADETGELPDYKFFCFNGEPKAMFIATERNSGDVKFDYYDINFNKLNIVQFHKESGKSLPKPQCFDEMIRLSKILSWNMPHVRVDLYEIAGKVYFGELTFFHHSGLVPFSPNRIDKLWGSWIELPHFKCGH
ncbi:MAG TPA: ATP-grasp fold amidoligase family protein [Bacteroidales bacterium]|nr:ATP-grasp fold amidoligase family protein [Bacteroidales bacterium]